MNWIWRGIRRRTYTYAVGDKYAIVAPYRRYLLPMNPLRSVKRLLKVIFPVFCISMIFLVSSVQKSEYMAGRSRSRGRLSSAPEGVKTILFWNPWYSWEDYQFGFGRAPFVDSGCAVDTCRTTANRSEFGSADAVIFFARSLKYLAPIVVPRRLKNDQVYVFFNMESPYKRLGHYHVLNGFFNLTVSYRLDSDIPMPHYDVIPKEPPLVDAPVTRSQILGKDKLVTWLVSHCAKGKGMRIAYAQQLAQHVDVEIFGDCGPHDCPSLDTHECMLHLEANYKFYLAFENSVCADYVTEKAFRTLQYNLVPIVWGGANYTRQLPPHSFVNVRDFSSPKHLADYLQYLDRHDQEYLKYFKWKRDYDIQEFPVKNVFCRMCEILQTGREIRSNIDMEQWWENEANCVLNKDLPRHFRFKAPDVFEGDDD